MHHFKASERRLSRASAVSNDEPLAKKPRLLVEGTTPLTEAITAMTPSSTISSSKPIEVEAVKEAPQAQALLTTAVTLEFGENLDSKCTIHLTCLVNRSQRLKELFDLAATSYQGYERVKKLRRSVKALLCPEMTPEAFLGQNVDENFGRAINIISICINKLPLTEYQQAAQRTVEQFVDMLFQDKNNWNDPTIKRKDYQTNEVTKRLNVMTAKAVLSVVSRLHQFLWRIKVKEDEAARGNELKAAAQHRIILTGFDQETVGSMMHWAYNGAFEFNNASHLTKLHSLAMRLGMDGLGEKCLEVLANATRLAIENAAVGGLSVQDLLEITRSSVDDATDSKHDPLSDIVRVVFAFVCKHHSPPKELRAIVLEAIADSADHGLVSLTLELMNSELRGDLCVALVHRHWKLHRHGSVGELKPGSVKSEVKLKVHSKPNRENMKQVEKSKKWAPTNETMANGGTPNGERDPTV